MSETDLIGTDLRLDIAEFDLESSHDDLMLVSDVDNLAQAVFLRLKTSLGALPFRSEYGSRLHHMLGKGQSTQNELIAEMLVGEALLRDPRILDVSEINVEYNDNYLYISITVIGINSLQPADVRMKMRV